MTKKLSWLAAILLVLCCASVTLAEQKQGWPTLTLGGGGYSLGSSSGLNGDLLYGIKLGYELNGRGFAERLGVEGVFQQIDGELEADKSAVTIKLARLDLLYLIDLPKSFKKIAPFLTVGGGAYWLNGDNLAGSHSSTLLAYGLGSKFMFTDYLGLRLDLRQLLVFDDDTRTDYEYTLGLTYRFGVEKKERPIVDIADNDKDGILDSKDKCLDTPSGLAVDKSGCPVNPPDSDGDGVPDYQDQCADTPDGLAVDKYGCFFDDDNDGVPNELDRCPANPPGFQVDENGCTKLIRRSEG